MLLGVVLALAFCPDVGGDVLWRPDSAGRQDTVQRGAAGVPLGSPRACRWRCSHGWRPGRPSGPGPGFDRVRSVEPWLRRAAGLFDAGGPDSTTRCAMDSLKTVVLPVMGMSCSNCAAIIETGVAPHPRGQRRAGGRGPGDQVIADYDPALADVRGDHERGAPDRLPRGAGTGRAARRRIGGRGGRNGAGKGAGGGARAWSSAAGRSGPGHRGAGLHPRNDRPGRAGGGDAAGGPSAGAPAGGPRRAGGRRAGPGGKSFGTANEWCSLAWR